MPQEINIVVLVGPKGAGKTTLGTKLDRVFGVRFLRAESIWLQHGQRPRDASWERDGFREVARAAARALEESAAVVVETTGASAHTGAFLEDLRALGRVHLVRVEAPLEQCALRVRRRSASDHIAVSDEQLAAINARAIDAAISCDATFDNAAPLDEPAVRAALGALLRRLGVAERAKAPVLRTARLVLRPMRSDDDDAFAAINADPRVMEHFPSTLSRAESDALADRLRATFDDLGFGFWAVEVPGVAPFVGFCGLGVPSFEAPFTPAVEIGWRLAAHAWGHGYAREGARAALAFAFDEMELPEVVAFTVPGNVRSRRVMESIGMSLDPAGAFEHPRLPVGHPLRPHVLYRIERARGVARGEP